MKYKYNYDQISAELPEPDSDLSKLYHYLWENPYAKRIPSELVPRHYKVCYVYQAVKHLRDGTGLPELTLQELEDILDEEIPNWKSESVELPDSFYEERGMSIPIRK